MEREAAKVGPQADKVAFKRPGVEPLHLLGSTARGKAGASRTVGADRPAAVAR
jgi:hypothetical protein